jgi:hypothetical protein
LVTLITARRCAAAHGRAADQLGSAKVALALGVPPTNVAGR